MEIKKLISREIGDKTVTLYGPISMPLIRAADVAAIWCGGLSAREFFEAIYHLVDANEYIMSSNGTPMLYLTKRGLQQFFMLPNVLFDSPFLTAVLQFFDEMEAMAYSKLTP